MSIIQRLHQCTAHIIAATLLLLTIQTYADDGSGILSFNWSWIDMLLGKGVTMGGTVTSTELDCNRQTLALGCIAMRLMSLNQPLAEFITGIAYMSGLGFVIAAAYKFKQVRENPTQVPASTPLALLLVAVLLMFLPGVIRIGGNSLFGQGNSTSAGFTGSGGTTAKIIERPPADPISVDTNTGGIAGIIRNLARVNTPVARMILAVTYGLGISFAIGAVFKLKAYRDNPQQTTIGVPLSYMFISVMLMYSPSLINSTQKQIFGNTNTEKGYETGSGIGTTAEG